MESQGVSRRIDTPWDFLFDTPWDLTGISGLPQTIAGGIPRKVSHPLLGELQNGCHFRR